MKNEIRLYRANGELGFLSNLFPSKIEFEGRTFRNAEEAYQYGKPLDKKVKDWIVSAPKPHLTAMAAHSLLYYDIVPWWNEIKVDRMKKILRIKFADKIRAEQLLDTLNATLIEDSKTDNFWGIGKKGTGKNMLGVLLMEVREELRKESFNE
jgi:ribA/ribD-fused uncharacterized protein